MKWPFARTAARRRVAMGLVALTGLLSQPVRSAEEMSHPRDWAAALRADATALHALVTDSHPGVHDRLNPEFRHRLDAGLATAMKRAGQVRDAGGWWWALRAYVASFEDGHMQLALVQQGYSFPSRWPGFLTVYRGDEQVVMGRDESDPATPPVGARLIECDGVPARKLGEQRIGQFRGRWFLESQRAQFGDFEFINASNPWIVEPRRCRLESAGGVRTYTLRWREIAASDLGARRGAVARRAAAPWGVTIVPDGGYWIGMPSFDGTPGGEPHQALTSMLRTLDAARAALRRAPYVVLDVRGNGGGSSQWSVEIARAIWGDDWTTAHTPRGADAVEWRASAGNIAELDGFLRQLRADGSSAELTTWAERAVTGMRAARAAGELFWRDAEDAAIPPAAATATVPPLSGRVFVLTDASCASACLDAVDLWKAAGAMQIGRETSADTVYMEVRSASLPSGLAEVALPMKVYRGRARGNNEPQRPTKVFAGDMSDDVALREWVQSLL